MNPFSVVFKEALKYAKKRKIVLPDEYYQKMTARQRKQAVSIAGLAKLSLIGQIMSQLQKVLESGGTFKDFQKDVNGVLPKHRLDNIFRTNIQMAYAQGRHEQQQANKKRRPYLMYSAINDKRTRHDHARLDGVIRPIDDSFWDKHTPPIDYRCRCTVLALTEKEAKEKGVTSDDNLPKNVQTFGSSPKSYTDDLIKLVDDVPTPPMGDSKVWNKLKNDIKSHDVLPPPQEWQSVAKIGEELYKKHQHIFDKVDFGKPFDFSNAVREVMKIEGVKVGGEVSMIGEYTEKVQSVLNAYPTAWIEKSNELGKIVVKNSPKRGYHLLIDNPKTAEALQNKDYFKFYKLAEFKKFAGKINHNDSLVLLNYLEQDGVFRLSHDITIHEFGHRLQSAMPELDEYFTQFWIARTKGEKTRPLAKIQSERGEFPTYDKKEVGRKDNFANVYVGKNYGTDDNPAPKEVLTMTFQQLLGSNTMNYATDIKPDTEKYWQNDREMLYLGLALLIRYKP